MTRPSARWIVFALAVLAVVGSAAGSAKAQEERFVTIGTGGVTGVYYPAGGAIQRLVNRHSDRHGIRVSVEATQGSVYNLNAMAAGEQDIGVAQSDWQAQAYAGGNSVFPQPNPKLRSVMSLHAEPFTIVARADAGITTLNDLRGKRINIGNPGSGQRATMEVLIAKLGWTRADFAQVTELSSSEQSQALCDDSFDAMVFSVGHPSGSIQEAAASCGTVLVRIEGAAVDALIAENAYYAAAVIPGGMYSGSPDPTPTFGVRATLVTTEDQPEDVIYTIVKAVIDDIDTLRRLHPAFVGLDLKEMATLALTAPLHDGARRAFTEAGLL